MELILNLAWLFVTVGAVAAWLRSSPLARPHRFRLELLSLAAVCLLLFPLISLSDDLQAEAILAEGNRAQVSAKNSDAEWAQRAPSRCAAPMFALVPPACSLPAIHLVGIIVPADCFAVQPDLAHRSDSRAPPSRA